MTLCASLQNLWEEQPSPECGFRMNKFKGKLSRFVKYSYGVNDKNRQNLYTVKAIKFRAIYEKGRFEVAYYETLKQYLEDDRPEASAIDRVTMHSVRRLDIPLHSDYQMRDSGKVLVELGERLQRISRYNWMERTKLWHCLDAISATREILKRKLPKGHGARRKSTY